MPKIIKTQNGELINFANIVEISLAEGEGQNKNKETLTMYALVCADVHGTERELGVFDTESQLDKAFELLEFFLAFSVETMFEIPDEIDSEESEND